MTCNYWRANKIQCCALWDVVTYCLAGSLGSLKQVEERNLDIPDCWVQERRKK